MKFSCREREQYLLESKRREVPRQKKAKRSSCQARSGLAKAEDTEDRSRRRRRKRKGRMRRSSKRTRKMSKEEAA